MPVYFVYALDRRDEVPEPCKVVYRSTSAADVLCECERRQKTNEDADLVYTSDAPEMVF